MRRDFVYDKAWNVTMYRLVWSWNYLWQPSYLWEYLWDRYCYFKVRFQGQIDNAHGKLWALTYLLRMGVKERRLYGRYRYKRYPS